MPSAGALSDMEALHRDGCGGGSSKATVSWMYVKLHAGSAVHVNSAVHVDSAEEARSRWQQCYGMIGM